MDLKQLAAMFKMSICVIKRSEETGTVQVFIGLSKHLNASKTLEHERSVLCFIVSNTKRFNSVL